MTDAVATAYKELAELLTTLRRVVGRWIEKAHGDGSFDLVCPPEMAERLLARRRREAKLGRAATPTESLIVHASFTDLSELMLDHLELLDRLVPRLAESPEELLRRLEEMEVVRLEISRADSVTAAEIQSVREFHERLIGALKNPTQAQGGNGTAPDSPAVADPDARVEPDAGSEAGAGGPEGDDVAIGQEAGPVLDETFGVEQALAAGDDGHIVRALHEEVTALAEEAITSRPERRAAVWARIRDAGWIEANLETLGLEPVARFHDVLDELRNHSGNGASGDELRRIRDELKFTDLLLEMRESFLRLC